MSIGLYVTYLQDIKAEDGSSTDKKDELIVDIEHTIKEIDERELPESTDFLSEAAVRKLMTNKDDVEDVLRHITIPNALKGCRKILQEIQGSLKGSSETADRPSKDSKDAENGEDSDANINDTESSNPIASSISEGVDQTDGDTKTDVIVTDSDDATATAHIQPSPIVPDHLSPIISTDAEKSKYVSMFFEGMNEGHGGNMIYIVY
jgi:hypothetical protein